MIRPPKVSKSRTIQRKSIRSWKDGYFSGRDAGRTPEGGLNGAGNAWLKQDGTIAPRPSLVRYGTQPTGTILGEVYEFVDSSTSTPETWLITLQNVAGTTKAYISQDGGAWSVCNGKTYDNSAKAHFKQVDDKVLIMNGVDNLSYLDIASATVIPFTSLSTPVGVSATPAVITTGSYQYRAVITASNQGETAGSTAITTTVSKPRDLWNGSTEGVTIVFNRVTNAERYNIYVGDTAGNESYIVTIPDPGSGTQVTYFDNGTVQQDVTRTAPLGDTTAGPICTRAEVVNGRLFLVGDVDMPYAVRFGGTGDDTLDLSPYDGGGWIEIGKGTKEFPVAVKSFRTGQGTPAIMVLCRGTNGTGKRYILTEESTTYGETVITYMTSTEDNGQDGTDSPDGVILYKDALWYPSRDSFKTTYTKQQVQNILSTDGVSDKIENDVKRLNTATMDKCVGLAYQGRLFWALPVGSTDNNQIWTLDLSDSRKGAWMLPWHIDADWIWLYNDNDGETHFCVLKDNVIYELSENQATNDDGTAFSTFLNSGIQKFSDDGQEWAKVIKVTAIIIRPQGEITFSISGKTEDSDSLQTIGAETFIPDSSVSGWGEMGWDQNLGWADTETVPTSYGDDAVPIQVEIDEELKWWRWSLTSTDSGVDYQLSDIIIEFVPTGTKDES